MGFYNIMLEGQQAEEYLADRVRAEKAKEKEELEKAERRYGHTVDKRPIGAKYSAPSNPNHASSSNQQLQQDINRHRNAAEVFDRRLEQEDDEGKLGDRMAKIDPSLKRKMEDEDYIPTRKDIIKQNHQGGFYDDIDAINRHMRRHPDQWGGDKRIKTRSESGIFESVEFLNG